MTKRRPLGRKYNGGFKLGNQNNIKEKRTSTRRGRGCLIWLGGVLAGLLVLLLAGAIYESLAEAADAQAYPPPGQMVDVGGYRLHINCTGSGSPTVVIDSRLGGFVCRVGLGAARSRQDHAHLHLRSGRDGMERGQSPAADCPGIC